MLTQEKCKACFSEFLVIIFGKMKNKKTVCVLGAGIAGATVAYHLNQAGVKIYLVEKKAGIGGHAVEMGCKATDICLRCNVCVANELLRTVCASPDIQIHTQTQLSNLSAGENGSRYTATLKHKPNFINRYKCTNCQACITVCPEKCIEKPNSGLFPTVPVIDYSQCRLSQGKKCSICEEACPVDAISMREEDSESKIDIDSLVIATGYEPFDPGENASYGYGKSSNIITGIEAEQQLAATGKITRPSDGLQPKRVAFIQCVGSRTEEVYRRPEDTDYCSTVCCAYALRIGQLIKHQNNEAEVTVFYMDIQKFGKGFDDFYKKCKDSVNFIRSRPYEIKQDKDGTLNVKFAQKGKNSQVSEQQFDLLVLSVGIRPNQDTRELAETLLVPVDEYGFLGLKSASSLPDLQQDGIFAAGACESPKDMQSCMTQAEAVSAAVIKSLFGKQQT
jgi:heterodisulfide reductase subunit A